MIEPTLEQLNHRSADRLPMACMTALLAACSVFGVGLTAAAEDPQTPATQNAAAGPVLTDSAPQRYTVRSGDTLWSIASMYLRDPWLWPEIWYVNPQVENPHLIYPGDVLVLAYGADGRPQLSVERGTAM